MTKAASSERGARGRGRPREFDLDAALDKAVRVFRESGYRATSINDLTQAMGLASGSVYKAFKDKRAVFVAAFGRERERRWEKLQRIAIASKPARERIRDALIFNAEASYGAEGKRGCLLVCTAAELSTFDDEVGRLVAASLRQYETLMADLIRQGQLDGSIPTTIDGDATARAILCLQNGMRVVGKAGRNLAEMTAVVDTAMKLLG